MERTRRGVSATGVLAWLVSAALACAAAAPPVSAQRKIVASFDAVVEEARARQVRFEWTISPERADEEMSCAIDVDADDPSNPDAFVPGCDEDTSFEHTYEEPGTYQAALTITSAAGGSERVIVTVVVS